jgi:hypothetical protein
LLEAHLAVVNALRLALLLEKVGDPLADHRGGARDDGENFGLRHTEIGVLRIEFLVEG